MFLDLKTWRKTWGMRNSLIIRHLYMASTMSTMFLLLFALKKRNKKVGNEMVGRKW